MRTGIYKHKGHFYQLLTLARNHYDDTEWVVYIPLRIEPEWAGTLRFALRTKEDFTKNFEFISEALPSIINTHV